MDSTASSVAGLRRVSKAFLQDLEALPEGAFDQTFGKASRSVADIVYEVILVNDDICMAIRGETPEPWPHEGWVKAPEGFRTKDAVLEGFRLCSDRTLATVDALSPEELEAPLATEHGESTRAERCRFMTLHLWYHSGQLNFIQTLLGDDAWHWN